MTCRWKREADAVPAPPSMSRIVSRLSTRRKPPAGTIWHGLDAASCLRGRYFSGTSQASLNPRARQSDKSPSRWSALPSPIGPYLISGLTLPILTWPESTPLPPCVSGSATRWLWLPGTKWTLQTTTSDGLPGGPDRRHKTRCRIRCSTRRDRWRTVGTRNSKPPYSPTNTGVYIRVLPFRWRIAGSNR